MAARNFARVVANVTIRAESNVCSRSRKASDLDGRCNARACHVGQRLSAVRRSERPCPVQRRTCSVHDALAVGPPPGDDGHMTSSSAPRSGAVSDGRPRDVRIWRRAMGGAKTPSDVPVYRADLYSQAAIRDPYPHYATMRALGPVVWLPKQRLYAIPRYAEVKGVLRDADTFRSAGGVALNTISRTVGRRSFLMMDGAEHDRVRKLSAHRLIPRALRPLQTQIDDLAEETVRAAVANGRVDGVRDIALRLPLSVVPDLVGWPEGDREHLVAWAGATFDLLGPFQQFGRAVVWRRLVDAGVRASACPSAQRDSGQHGARGGAGHRRRRDEADRNFLRSSSIIWRPPSTRRQVRSPRHCGCSLPIRINGSYCGTTLPGYPMR